MRKIGLLVLMVLSLAACNVSVEDRTERAMAEMERTEPTFALLRQHDPQAHAELRALIGNIIRDDGTPQSGQLVQRGRAIVARAVARRMSGAPDEIVVRFAAFVADQARSLDGNPQVCRDLLLGTAGDVRPYLDQAMQQREKQLIADLLTTPSAGPRRVATQDDGEAVVSELVADAPAALGLSEQDVITAFDGGGPPQNVCRVNEALFRRISQLPPEQGAALFRLIQQLGAEAMPRT